MAVPFTSVLSQKFTIMGKGTYLTNKFAPNCNILLPLSSAFLSDKAFALTCVNEAISKFKSLGLSITDEIYTNNYAQLAKYGVLYNSFVFGYDLKTGKLALYTNSTDLLKQLRKQGILVNKKGNIDALLQQIDEVLNNANKISKTFEEPNKLITCRLDLEMIADKFYFTPTGLRLTINTNDIVLVPYRIFEVVMETFNSDLQDVVFKIVQGDKIRIITKNRKVLEELYGKSRTDFLLSQQYNVMAAKMYAPVVGASIYTAGVTQVKLTDLSSIQMISLEEAKKYVDFEDIKLDLSSVKSFFFDSLKDKNDYDVRLIAETYGVRDVHNKSLEQVIEELQKEISTIPNHELWALMKASNAFDLDKYRKMPSKFGTSYNSVEIPKTKEDLDKLLKTGVFKILSIKRDGTYSTVIGTNSPKSLNAILGKDYLKYESEGVRLRYAANYVKSYLNGEYTFSNVNDLFKYYFLEDKVTHVIDGASKLTGSELLEKIKGLLSNVDDRTTVMKQPHLSTIRCLDVETNSGGFYRSIDVKTIVEIVQLSE